MGGGVGQGVGDAGAAVAVGTEPGGGLDGGASFLGFEGAAFEVVPGVGGQDFEDLADQDPQLPGAEGCGLVDEVGLGLLQQLRTEFDGQVVQTEREDAGLLPRHAALEERLLEVGVVLVEGFRDPDDRGGGVVVQPGFGGVPVGHVPSTGLLGDVTGDRQQPGQDSLGTCDQTGVGTDRGLLVTWW